MVTVQITVRGLGLDYEKSKSFADLTVSHLSKESMIVSWYDGQKNIEHPSVPECQHKPGWISYAEGHGGNVKIDINDGEFVFIYNTMTNVEFN
jgi:Domain of unknown function (DUF5619)